jgi:hypothetical protein
MKLVVLLIVGWLFVVACDDPNRRDSGPELTAEEAGVYSVWLPRDVALVLGDNVVLHWKHFGYTVDFVIVRRAAVAGSAWQEVAVVPNTYPDPQLLPHFYPVIGGVPGATYIYGVKARNNNKHGVLIDSAIVETAPVTLRAIPSQQSVDPPSSSQRLPASVTARVVTSGIEVRWDGIASSGIFVVLRRDAGSPHWFQLATIGGLGEGATLDQDAHTEFVYSYLDTRMHPGRRVIYGVRVRDERGDGPVVEASELTMR